MKKLFLLLAGSAITMGAAAQTSVSSVRLNPDEVNLRPLNHAPSAAAAYKTTAVGGKRWYDYINTVLSTNIAVPGVTFFGIPIWQDTTAIFGYTGTGGPTYYDNKWTSVGLGFNPMYYPWNDSVGLIGFGLIKIKSTNAYTIDSVAVLGSYLRSDDPTKTSVVDTLVFGMVYGDGTSTSNMPGYYFTGMATRYLHDTVRFLAVMHDSVNNTADASGGPAPYIVKFPLHATDSAINFGRAIPVSFAVPAGNLAAATVSFRSGDASWAMGDTVQRADGTNKYHNFSVTDGAAGTSSTTLQFPPYDPKDWTSGYWKREGAGDAGWGGMYIPNWSWSTGTPPAASALQYPYIVYHVTCSTCDTIHNSTGVASVAKNLTSVSAYPNPASSEAVVTFNLINRANVTVTLSDMLGKTIATQTIANVIAGKATITTSSLPNGMYLYTVEASGERFTGKLSVAH